jgi:hypothetical protein
MPAKQKRTTEQWERALKRAKNAIARQQRHYNRLNNHSKAQQDKIFEAERELEAETSRADNLKSVVDELRDLRLREKLETAAERAVQTEISLIHSRKALEAANAVNMGLLDVVKKATAPMPPMVTLRGGHISIPKEDNDKEDKLSQEDSGKRLCLHCVHYESCKWQENGRAFEKEAFKANTMPIGYLSGNRAENCRYWSEK